MSSEKKQAPSKNDPKRERLARRERLTERLQAVRERAHLLELELHTYTNEWFRVCIFGSARIKPHEPVYELVKTLARYLGEHGIDVLTGGGPGLMEAANKGLLEGRNKSGSQSKSFGISIELHKFESLNEHLDIKHHHRKFSSRLDDFMRLSNAIVVTPGGIGTLLEMYFSWQLIQVGHMTSRPIILLGKEFWSGLVDWTREKQVKGNLVSPGDLDCIHIVDTPEEAMVILRDEYIRFEKQRGQ